MPETRERIYFSRFPDVRVAIEAAQPTELVTIHQAPNGYIVFAWIWDEYAQDWEQAAPLYAANLDTARSLVPAAATRMVAPEDFAVECWAVRA